MQLLFTYFSLFVPCLKQTDEHRPLLSLFLIYVCIPFLFCFLQTGKYVDFIVYYYIYHYYYLFLLFIYSLYQQEKL